MDGVQPEDDTVDFETELRRGRVVVRFAGDSGDGIQLLGGAFGKGVAASERDMVTFSDFPAEIRAPVAGIASQMERLQVGQLMVQGLPAISIVKTDVSWIEANFKETDIADIRVGQPVTIEIDSYPDLQFHGTVESLGAGTGSEFSILPAQNATGNWVKITQRVPVRITIDGPPEPPLIAGLSAYVRVDTSER